jgi:dihydrofolate reductase/thymidylate synthase
MSAYDLIVAVDERSGIGKAGRLPWTLRGDMRYFKDVTTRTTTPGRRNAVVMGRQTWESIPARFRPLAGRLNLVLTRQAAFALPGGVLRANDFPSAIASLSSPAPDAPESIFVIGGASLYREALRHDGCRSLYITRVQGVFDCDAFFEEPRAGFGLVSRSAPACENGVTYCFEVYRRT